MSSARSSASASPYPANPYESGTAPAYFGNRQLHFPAVPVTAHLEIDGLLWTGIRHVDGMAPFFTTSVGDNDTWVYAGSNGALCAGRRDPDLAMFPYVTVDRILEHARSAGFLSVFRLSLPGGSARLWEPWSDLPAVHPRERSLFKHPEGNGLCFEEVDLESGVTFRVVLGTCAPYGLVKESRLENRGHAPVSLQCLDGWHRIVPPGAGTTVWKNFSYLAQAYMRHDRVPGLPMGVFTLNAAITDRAEPMEVQRAAVAWMLGLPEGGGVLLSTRQVEAFRAGLALADEQEIRGETGAFLAAFDVQLKCGAAREWTQGLDTNLDHGAALRVRSLVASPANMLEDVRASLLKDRAGLRRRLASADGLERTGDVIGDEHHLSNTLFNLMRGGSLPADLLVEREAFLTWLEVRNRVVAAKFRDVVSAWPERLRIEKLGTLASLTGDAQLQRLAGIYLPLSFSRRHGDPSRPWNQFSIRLTNEAGKPVVSWQGNWRDIFQNWEALALSFPTALPGMISLFLDASSADGYNPYRITSEGVDWEVPEPHNPWAHYGYWGDHQIVYLQRLLTLAENFFPGLLTSRLALRTHVCVDIPYRLVGVEAALANPRDTVHFDKALHQAALEREQALGTDGRLVLDSSGQPLLFSLAEKLLIPVLAKLSNWVPGGGIWLSTQRPEWNDANNALVGHGLSMVTVCQLRRHVEVLSGIFGGEGGFPCTAATAEWLRTVYALLLAETAKMSWSNGERLTLVRTLGAAAEAHRTRVYTGDWGAFESVEVAEVRGLLATARSLLETTISGNRRDDGLYHSYNLVEFSEREARVGYLPLMLEGQVAALGSGYLGGEEALALLHQLRASALYRPDQSSYLLYPNKALKPYLERNAISGDRLSGLALPLALLKRRDRRVLLQDFSGTWHFAPELVNAADLERALDLLAKEPALQSVVAAERLELAGVWEETFSHKSFLGRSGTMFAFEGLGSIYWHMVSKLMLSVQEVYFAARARGEPNGVLAGLASKYYEIRSGLGPAKSPAVFGAFPTDPYSHTPAHRGAQQPGMTGQVKEELLARRGELGVVVENGCLTFVPSLLRAREFVKTEMSFSLVNSDGEERGLTLASGMLAFTICQVPVLLRLSSSPCIRLFPTVGDVVTVEGLSLDREKSSSLFLRRGVYERLEVDLERPALL